MATEVPENSILQDLTKKTDARILAIPEAYKYFLESRLATSKALHPQIKYIFPIQEDFLLGGRIDDRAIEEALTIFDEDPSVASIRLMPCPGPKQDSVKYKNSSFLQLDEDFMFTFQATLWRRECYELYLSAILDMPMEMFSMPPAKDENQRKKFFQVDFNIAENTFGQRKFREVLGNKIHLAWPRAHPHPNAVMLSPWPYRPTAVEKGKVGEWVYEFAKREGFVIPRD